MEIFKRRGLISLIAILILGCVFFGLHALSVGSGALDNPGRPEGRPLQKITFALDWTPNTNHTGLFVAKENGYFKELGLEVEFVQPPEDTATALVASKKADFGIDFQDTLAPAFASDIPVTAIAAIVQHNTSGIISLKENNITSPKGLENRKYATWDLPVEQAILSHCVKLDGGDYNKINLIPTYVIDVVIGLQTDVDAVWIYYGWDGIATKVNNLETNFFFFKDIDPMLDYYTPVIVGNNEFMLKNPEITKKFLDACKKGYEYAIDNPEAAANILLKEDPSLDPTLVLESQKWMSREYKANEEQWGYIDSSRWNSFYKWLYDNELIGREIMGGFSNEYL